MAVTTDVAIPDDVRSKRECWPAASSVIQSGGCDSPPAIWPLRAAAVRAAADDNGTMDASLATPPGNVILEQAGLVQLVDLAQAKIPLQQLGVAVTDGYAQAHPDTVLRFTKAYIEAIHRWKTDKTFAEDEMRTYLATNDQAQLDDSYDAYKDVFEKMPIATD